MAIFFSHGHRIEATCLCTNCKVKSWHISCRIHPRDTPTPSSFYSLGKAVMLPSAVFLTALTVLIGWTNASEYREQLSLRPLPQSSLLAAFNFQSNTTQSAFEQQNYNLFPRSLGQILQHAHAKELHLRFSLGRWDAQNWGSRPRGGRREGGTGVELWAWVEADSDEQ